MKKCENKSLPADQKSCFEIFDSLKIEYGHLQSPVFFFPNPVFQGHIVGFFWSRLASTAEASEEKHHVLMSYMNKNSKIVACLPNFFFWIGSSSTRSMRGLVFVV